MPGIKLEQPLNLCMEVVESDVHVPSMRVETKITITQFQHVLNYQGTFWFDCTCWSDFVNGLSDLSRDALLKDMNDYFILAIREKEGKKFLFWEFKKIDIDRTKKTTVAFSAEIDDDMLGKIKKEFTEFPVWW